MKTKKKRIAAKVDIRVRLPVLLDEALEQATAYACRRAFKHRDGPIETPERLIQALDDHVRTAFWSVLGELGVEIE